MKYLNTYSALIVLILVTFSLLFVYNKGLYKTFNVDLDGSFSIIGTTDAAQGGESTIEVDVRKDGVYFKCDIVAEYRWPYCEIKIHLVPHDNKGQYDMSNGFDLSEYDEIFLDAEYVGSAPERLRIYLRNHNAAYTDFAVDENSMKINELKFSPNKSPYGEYFKLSDFNVASWWSGERDLPSHLQGLEFNNVPLIEIASSSYAEYGEMEVFIREITLRRLYITKENLLFSIIAMWVGSAFIFLFTQMSLYRIRFMKSKESQERLLEILQALQIEKNEIDKMAKRDSLTGLRNRAGLSKHFSECGQALIEKKTPFSIVFIDIDFFKKFNDTHGHNIGDEILTGFAQVIYNNIRIADKLGRWGGEEFILICKNSCLKDAIINAEKLCNIVEDTAFINDLRVTASFGVAEMKRDETTKEFIERADKALYAAKTNGRNQVQASA